MTDALLTVVDSLDRTSPMTRALLSVPLGLVAAGGFALVVYGLVAAER